MFIARGTDGSIYGTWTVRQSDDKDHAGIEEVSDDHPDVLAYLRRPIPKARIDDGELLGKLLIQKGVITQSEIDATQAAAVDAKL